MVCFAKFGVEALLIHAGEILFHKSNIFINITLTQNLWSLHCDLWFYLLHKFVYVQSWRILRNRFIHGIPLKSMFVRPICRHTSFITLVVWFLILENHFFNLNILPRNQWINLCFYIYIMVSRTSNIKLQQFLVGCSWCNKKMPQWPVI